MLLLAIKITTLVTLLNNTHYYYFPFVINWLIFLQ